MRLGLLTAPFDGTELVDVADWASSNGFDMLEVACWPSGQGATRRYGGVCHIDVVAMTADRADEIVGELSARGITISGLGYYPNALQPDDEARTAIAAHLKELISAAALMRVPVVNTFMGADQTLTQQENWIQAKGYWPAIVSHAEGLGVKIAIENCPMIFSDDEWPSGQNLAYSPAIWRTIFEEFGETVGLNLDPSHLVWQHIDMPRAIDEFGERIYHAHAKDLMIDRDGLYEHGILSLGMGWQVPRLPGLGDVDWQAFFSALYRTGYDYVCCVEHEDRQWEGTDELIKRGFLLARDTLAPYIH
ncbi:MAG: sugar phosphate isomerase/epimerase [Acidimicrobiia bacterium]|nr:sugar phosphate isomerase/epimerase [Acidimicrobiia bacterium]